MEAVKRNVSIYQSVMVITCPKCRISFSVNYIGLSCDEPGAYYSTEQVPDAGGKFFCPYCGVNVNKKYNHRMHRTPESR